MLLVFIIWTVKLLATSVVDRNSTSSDFHMQDSILYA